MPIAISFCRQIKEARVEMERLVYFNTNCNSN